MDARSSFLLGVAVFSIGFTCASADAMGKAKDCVVNLDSSDLAHLFDHYVSEGSNGRSPAAAIYQTDLDGEAARTLYSRNPGAAQAVASTQKIVTAWTAIKYGNLSQKIEFVEGDLFYDDQGDRAKWPSTGRLIMPGDKVPLKDLLYTLLIQSSNGAAQAIARGVGKGDVRAFVKLMNQEANSLLDGSDVHSYFQNPHGLTDTDSRYVFGEPGRRQQSTASNMARMLGRMMADSGFRSGLGKAGLSSMKAGELRKLGHTDAAGKTIVARIPLTSACGERAVSMAFFGADTDDQFTRFAALIDEFKKEVSKNTQVIR